jgi:hypothetical protein
MTAEKAPLELCVPVSPCTPVKFTNLPFGLPATTWTDPCCQGVDASVIQINQQLAPLLPFLQLIDCATKLIDIVTAIPKSIGPPPDIGKLASIGQLISDFISKCLPLIISYTPIGMVLPIICTVKHVIQVIMSMLSCLSKLVKANVAFTADALLMSNSSDPLLREQGICMTAQAAANAAHLSDQLGSVNGILLLITALTAVMSAVPGFPAITIPTSLSPGAVVDTAPIDELVVILTDIVQALTVLCPG